MTEAEIRAALGKRLQTLANAPPITWPGKPALREAPYLVVEFVAAGRSGISLGAAGNRQPGYMQVTVVTKPDAFEAQATTWADAITAVFPKGLRLTEGGTSVEIPQPASIAGQGYSDGAHWRLPVRVPYLALSA